MNKHEQKQTLVKTMGEGGLGLECVCVYSAQNTTKHISERGS